MLKALPGALILLLEYLSIHALPDPQTVANLLIVAGLVLSWFGVLLVVVVLACIMGSTLWGISNQIQEVTFSRKENPW